MYVWIEAWQFFLEKSVGSSSNWIAVSGLTGLSKLSQCVTSEGIFGSAEQSPLATGARSPALGCR